MKATVVSDFGEFTRAVTVVFILLWVQTAFAYSGGTGDPCTPYQIASKADLLELANDPCDYNDCFILVTDINLAGEFFDKAVIAPDTDSITLGFQGKSFTGIFDGNNHKITGVVIDGNEYVALLGQIDSPGQIKNLGVEGSVSGDNYVGGLIGTALDASISNCYSVGDVNGIYAVGGLVGGSTADLSDCYSTGSVSGTYDVGGLMGFNGDGGDVSDCYSTSSVSGDYYVSGLAGVNAGTISKCYSTGSVMGDYDVVGGLVGVNGGGYLSNCYSTGSVSGADYVGGLVGSNDGGNISNCYSTGFVSGVDDVGGLVGLNNGDITSSYFLETSGPDNGYGEPLSDPNMKKKSSFVGWDFDNIWRMCVDDVHYPLLQWQWPKWDYICPDGCGLEDYSVLAASWLQDDADINLGGEATIDIEDLLIIHEHWLQGR